MFSDRCLLDQDPIAQRHMAKINKYRGEYDKWGNRLTRSYLNVRHLLEDPETISSKKKGRGKSRRQRQKQKSFESDQQNGFNYNEYDEEDPYGDDFLHVDDIQFGNQNLFMN